MAASTAEGNKEPEGYPSKNDETSNDSQETAHHRLDLLLTRRKSSLPGKESAGMVSTNATLKGATADSNNDSVAGDSQTTKEEDQKSVRRHKKLLSGDSLPSVSPSSAPRNAISTTPSHIPLQRYQACVCLPLPEGEGNLVEELEVSVDSIPSDDLWEDEDLHRQFCEAVFNIGVSHATPSILRHGMQFQPPGLTTDRVKSHLQKFRNVLKKERHAFLHDYEKFVGFLELADKEGGEYGMIRLETLLGGKAVAHASHCIMREASQDKSSNKQNHVQSSLHNVFSTVMTEDGYGAGRIPMVQLTEEEAVTALGTSITYLQNLLLYMNRYLQEERQNCAQRLEKLLRGGGDHAKTVHQRQDSNTTGTIATKNKDTVPPLPMDNTKPANHAAPLAAAAGAPRIVDMVPNVRPSKTSGSVSSSSSSSGGFADIFQSSLLEPMDVGATIPGDREVLDNIASLGSMLAKKRKRAAPTINDYSLERENTRKRTKLAEQVLLDFGEMASLSSKRMETKGYPLQQPIKKGPKGVSKRLSELLQADAHDAASIKLSSKYSTNQSIDRSMLRGLFDDSGSKAAKSSDTMGGTGNFDSGNSVGASLRRWRKQMQGPSALVESVGNSKKGSSKPAWQKSQSDFESYFDDSSIESEDDSNQNIEQYMNAITQLKVSMANKQDEQGNNPANLLRWGADNDSLGSDDSSIWGGSFGNMLPPMIATNNSDNKRQDFTTTRPSMISIPQDVPAAVQVTGRPLEDASFGQKHERDLSTMSFQQMMSTLFPSTGDGGDGTVASVGSARSMLTRNSMTSHQQSQWHLPPRDSTHGTTNSLPSGTSNNYVPPMTRQNYSFGQNSHGTSIPHALTGMVFSHSTPSSTYVDQGFNANMNPSGNPNFGDLPLDFLRYAGLLGTNNTTAPNQGT